MSKLSYLNLLFSKSPSKALEKFHGGWPFRPGVRWSPQMSPKEKRNRFVEAESRSYQTFIFPIFRFSLLSLRVCSIWKNCMYCTMAKLSSKRQTNSSFTKKKSLVGLPPRVFLCYWKNSFSTLLGEGLFTWHQEIAS